MLLGPKILTKCAFVPPFLLPAEEWCVVGQDAFNPITSDVKSLANNLLLNGTIPGLSLAVVHLNGSFDSTSFGIKTEDNDEVTDHVSELELGYREAIYNDK